MRKETVEIYSDKTNAAVMRHPDRRFPGILLQGDVLHMLCYNMDTALDELNPSSATYDQLNDVRNALQSLKNHYKSTLAEHDMPLPFVEI